MNQIKIEIEQHLKEHILPFWMKLKDEKNGGFYGTVGYDLRVQSEGEKGGIAAARFLWSFSAAYRIIGDPIYKKHADHAYTFLMEKMMDREQGGLYWMLDYQGNPVDDEKHVYTQSFGIYALSEYYRAIGEKQALEAAMDLFDLVEEKGFNSNWNGYMEQFDRDWNPVANNKLGGKHNAAMTTNTHLHVLEAYTNLCRANPSPLVENKLKLLIELFHTRIFDQEKKVNRAFFDQNWTSLLDTVSYGHDIEASWLIDDALKVLQLESEDYHQMVLSLAYQVKEEGILPDGSLANEVTEGTKDETRVWWVQAEALVGFQNALNHTGNNDFADIIAHLWAYIQHYIVDLRDGGEWYWSIEPDGMPTKRPVAEPWKTPYHNSRCCLEMMERMNEK
ncbi:AGE family epimerase/isomerase [Jeotgalibacillus sp. ET6]|uniref:AGE family epimerase/isomerase n=1 Tax=Jeotgalibacillus sp. ET6 TaxID=3037260 RepID=UPI002418A360|nr:AGE family epimerase/isomerase [Jeotgalibacillus sp. ET6]MDG5471527.1 AGE family epimerase/isomerase [Jeotgalibacillus sp. ET6]